MNNKMIKTIFADGKSEIEALEALAGRGAAEGAPGSGSGAPGAEVEQAVRQIIDDVRREGDAAVVRYTLRFDGPDAAPGGKIGSLSRKDLKRAFEALDKPLADALLHAAENIREYHKKQLDALKGYESRGASRPDALVSGSSCDDDCVVIGQVVRGLERVGVYVPGGTAAYPSTVLMNVIPAKLAGVEEIVMVTPPRTGGAGEADFATDAVFATDAAILGAAYIAGADRVILAGGGQAVAALAYGTETFPRVDKIVGPGNIYVATAKRLLYGVVDIDMIAGPSEILIIADGAPEGAPGALGAPASPGAPIAAFAAADMLSQAEHDPDSAAILLTTDPKLAAAAAAQLAAQLKNLKRAETAAKAIENNSLIIVCRSEDEMVRLANETAPEHLEILTADPFALLTRIKNAGSVFLGPWTPEPVGDYYAGTNHVLPTNGTARFASPLGVYDFVKRMSYTHYTKEALREAKKDILEISGSEGLTAHANAVIIRFEE